MTRDRICLDSNVIVAAFVSRGLGAAVLRRILAEYQLVIPQEVAEEVPRVLAEKLNAPPEAVAAARAVMERSELLPRAQSPPPVSTGIPDDDRILAGGAGLLVTGVRHLLTMADESPIPILSPRAFLTLSRRHGE